MSMCTRSGIRPSVSRTSAGSGSTSTKLPPTANSTSSSPSRAASIISGAVLPGSDGTSKPHCSPSAAALSGEISTLPGKAVE